MAGDSVGNGSATIRSGTWLGRDGSELSVPAGRRPWGPDEFGSCVVQAGEFPPVVPDVDG